MIGECPDTVTDCRGAGAACIINTGGVVKLRVIPANLTEGIFEASVLVDDLVTA